ncbi:O-antigen ligase family protein [Deinococcus sp. KSM4-11]|uniref:O-antigen ligase family protein n=1 Tax=Deinococcus sp. KSM4-11 TaxID=2568654 RepID=UPI0010A4623C|nr:O-antigen ligase family protein [Deinococcus sp. KSM4-11]THF87134.1 O-antigen ligase family protein [Deinococcus sp. KSM4-11]
MSDRTAPGDGPAPLWLRVWTAILPAVYFLSPLTLLALPALRRLPRPVWWVLGAYALSQQLPALLTPDPLLASVLALGRTALMLGLIAAGAFLGSSRQLGVMGFGLALAYVTALGVALVRGEPLLAQRLTHPYMTSITLGLLGAAGLWIALFATGRVWWRVPLGASGLAILLLSGSRGPLAAAVIGAVLGLAVRSGRRLALGLVIGAAALTGAYVAGQQLGIPALERLNTTDSSGRDVIWYSALSVIHSAPLGGVGSYLLGDRLAPPGDPCTLWPTPEGAAPCPAWIARLGHPWLIAHNVTLQQLAETGPLGLLGLFVLLGVVVAAAALQRDALGIAVLTGLLVATANDNTLLVPGPFVGELFWITAGTVLVRLPAVSAAVGWAGGVVATALLGALSAPVMSTALPRLPLPSFRLSALIAPRTVKDPQDYAAYVRLNIPPGHYRLALQACQISCAWVQIVPVTVPEGGPAPVTRLSGHLYRVPQQRVELSLYPGKSAIRPEPLAQSSWTVRWTP